MAMAKTRSGSCAFDRILSIDETLGKRIFAEVQIKDALGVSQCFGAVDVLPVRVANVKGPQFLFLRELAHAIRERTVSVSPCCFESGEECWAAQEHSGVECVITGKIFTDVNDMIRFALDLRSVVQVKDTIHVVIDSQNDLVISERLPR